MTERTLMHHVEDEFALVMKDLARVVEQTITVSDCLDINQRVEALERQLLKVGAYAMEKANRL